MMMMVTQSSHTEFSSIIRGKMIINMKFSSRIEVMLYMSCQVTLINVKSYIYITHEVKLNQLKKMTICSSFNERKKKHFIIYC